MAFSGLVHKTDCYSLRSVERVTSVYKVVAPEIPESEARAFIAARKLNACRACFPVVRG